MPLFAIAIINKQCAMHFVESGNILVYFLHPMAWGIFILHLPRIACSSLANLILTYY
jgi:hypothetical protein